MENERDECKHSSSSPSAAAAWHLLPPEVQLRILSLLPPNERALGSRLVFKGSRDALPGVENCTVSLSQPLPAHAVPRALAVGEQHVRQLPRPAQAAAAVHSRRQRLRGQPGGGAGITAAQRVSRDAA